MLQVITWGLNYCFRPGLGSNMATTLSKPFLPFCPSSNINSHEVEGELPGCVVGQLISWPRLGASWMTLLPSWRLAEHQLASGAGQATGSSRLQQPSIRECRLAIARSRTQSRPQNLANSGWLDMRWLCGLGLGLKSGPGWLWVQLFSLLSPVSDSLSSWTPRSLTCRLCPERAGEEYRILFFLIKSKICQFNLSNTGWFVELFCPEDDYMPDPFWHVKLVLWDFLCNLRTIRGGTVKKN